MPWRNVYDESLGFAVVNSGKSVTDDLVVLTAQPLKFLASEKHPSDEEVKIIPRHYDGRLSLFWGKVVKIQN